jgi:hypothetical protein
MRLHLARAGRIVGRCPRHWAGRATSTARQRIIGTPAERSEPWVGAVANIEMPTLFRLVYFSRIAANERPRIAVTVQDILSVSQQRNAGAGITGLLIAANGYFVQALEGDRVSVEAIFSAISKDPRHNLPAIVLQGVTSERVFGGWAMAARSLTRHDARVIDRLEREGGFNPAVMSGAALLELLNAVAAVHRLAFDRQRQDVVYV